MQHSEILKENFSFANRKDQKSIMTWKQYAKLVIEHTKGPTAHVGLMPFKNTAMNTMNIPLANYTQYCTLWNSQIPRDIPFT